jgi:glycosyltransferase involved in cell wall biosynthesis
LEPPDCDVLRLGLAHLKTLRLPGAARKLFQFLRQRRIDVVQVHHADPTYLAVPVARWAGVPIVAQTKYDVGYWLTGADLWAHRQLRRWIDVTIANCQACREAAVVQERAPADDVVVIDNGIPTERLLEIPILTTQTWPLRLRIGTVANLRPVKDPETLVKAAKLLATEDPSLTFHLAGDGPLRSSVEQMIQNAGLSRRVLLHGHVADTVDFLRRLEIFVLCSRSEGLPHALLEAMAAGRAVVATAVGGNRELITHDVNGLLVPPGDAAALAAAIGRLAADPALATRLADAARRSVADRFSLAAMTERFSDFYQTLSRRSTWRAHRSCRPERPLSEPLHRRAEAAR